MKVYTVWTGEYSDRCMVAVFLDEKKAEKYAEVQTELDEYDYYWVTEYETQDDNFDMNATVKKFYFATVALEDRWNHDHTECWEREGEVTTDEMWDGFMEHLGIERYEDLDPKKYAKLIEEKDGRTIQDVEDDYAISDENNLDNRESYVSYFKGIDDVVYDITAYSQLGYHHARKIALDEYYKWKAQKEGIA